MKTAIVYTSKYGFTEGIVKELAKKLNLEEQDCINLRKAPTADISNYQRVIIGGPIYMGMMHKELRKFRTNNEKLLLEKELILFITCGAKGKEAEEQLRNNMGDSIWNHAKKKAYLGGKVNIDRLSPMHKFIMKVVSGGKEEQPDKNNGINEGEVSNLIQALG